MQLGMSLVCAHIQQIQQKLELSGGMTQTIFPRVEQWLDYDSDRIRALEWVAARKKMDRYRSIMDFLFCETFIDQRYACFKYYRGEGPQLKELITMIDRKAFERRLVMVLKVAYEAFCEKRHRSWVWILQEARKRAA